MHPLKVLVGKSVMNIEVAEFITNENAACEVYRLTIDDTYSYLVSCHDKYHSYLCEADICGNKITIKDGFIVRSIVGNYVTDFL